MYRFSCACNSLASCLVRTVQSVVTCGDPVDSLESETDACYGNESEPLSLYHLPRMREHVAIAFLDFPSVRHDDNATVLVSL